MLGEFGFCKVINWFTPKDGHKWLSAKVLKGLIGKKSKWKINSNFKFSSSKLCAITSNHYRRKNI